MAWRGMVLYRIWIYCIVLLVPSWYHMVLHWYGIVLNFIARYWVSFHYIVWYFMSLYCIWFQCIVLHVISTKVLYTSPHPEIPIQSTHPLIAPRCYIRLWRIIVPGITDPRHFPTLSCGQCQRGSSLSLRAQSDKWRYFKFPYRSRPKRSAIRDPPP